MKKLLMILCILAVSAVGLTQETKTISMAGMAAKELVSQTKIGEEVVPAEAPTPSWTCQYSMEKGTALNVELPSSCSQGSVLVLSGKVLINGEASSGINFTSTSMVKIEATDNALVLVSGFPKPIDAKDAIIQDLTQKLNALDTRLQLLEGK